jgi:hypothetical protein
MTREAQPIDISNAPELLRLAEEVCATRRPRLLQRAGEDVAMIVPVTTSKRGAKAPAAMDPVSVVQRTAGMLHQYAKHPPLTTEQERAAAERAIAEDAIERRTD